MAKILNEYVQVYLHMHVYGFLHRASVFLRVCSSRIISCLHRMVNSVCSFLYIFISNMAKILVYNICSGFKRIEVAKFLTEAVPNFGVTLI